MAFSAQSKAILDEHHQIAREVECMFSDYREFVTVYSAMASQVHGSDKRFYYLGESSVLYRVCRFRVKATLIENESDAEPEDLVDMQEIVLASEESVEYVLSIWQVNINDMVSPIGCPIPV